MPDTVRTITGTGWLLPCQDCGERPVVFQHWGHAAPVGSTVLVCQKCMNKRVRYYNRHGVALDLAGVLDYQI